MKITQVYDFCINLMEPSLLKGFSKVIYAVYFIDLMHVVYHKK